MSNISNAANDDLETVDRQFELKEQIYKLKTQLFTSQKRIRQLSIEYAETIIALKEELSRLQNGINRLNSQKHTMISLATYEEIVKKNQELSDQIENLSIQLQKQVQQRLTPNFQDPTLFSDRDNQIIKLTTLVQQWKNDCLKWRDQCLHRRQVMDEYHQNANIRHRTIPYSSDISTQSLKEQSLTDNLTNYYEKKMQEERIVWQKKQIEYEKQMTSRKESVSNAITKMSEEIVQLQNTLKQQTIASEKMVVERRELQRIHHTTVERLKEKIDVLEKREAALLQQQQRVVEEKQQLMDQKNRILQERDEQKNSLMREKELISKERDTQKKEYQNLCQQREQSLSEVVSMQQQLQLQSMQVEQMENTIVSLKLQNQQKEQIITNNRCKYQEIIKNSGDTKKINQKINDQLQRTYEEMNKIKQESKKQILEQEKHYTQIIQIIKIDLQEKNTQYNRVKTQLKEKSSSLISLTMSLKDAETDYRNLKHLFDDLEQKYNNLLQVQAQLKSMKEQLERVRRQTDQLQRIKQTNSTQMRTTTESTELKRQITNLTLQLTNAKQSLTDKQVQLKQLKKQSLTYNQQLYKQTQRYKGQLQREKQESMTLREEMRARTKQLEHIKKEQKSLEKLHQKQHFSFGGDKTRLLQLEQMAERERERSQSLLLQMASTERELSAALLQLSSKDEEIRRLKTTAFPPLHTPDHYQTHHQEPHFSPKNIHQHVYYSKKAPYTHRNERFTTQCNGHTFRDIEEENDQLKEKAREIAEERNVWKNMYRELKNSIAVCPHIEQRPLHSEHLKRPKRNQEKVLMPKVSKI